MRVGLGPPARPGQGGTLLAGLAIGALLLARFWPFDRFPILGCEFRRVTHLPCPGCGSTRAFVRLMHGDLFGGLHFSPLGASICFAAVAWITYTALRWTVLKRPIVVETTARETRALLLAGGVAVTANWIYLLVSGAAN